ncbi:MAG: alpha/beta fold hydrolase [Bacteroidales bacterium]
MKLFYRQFGEEGTPLIILHGIFGISDNWVTIGRRLGENFRVFIPDQRNHGQSPHSSTFNYFALVEDLAEFINDHHLYNPIIIGHSMGGKVAMNFALEYPGRVEKLVVIDISVRSYPARPEHMMVLQTMMDADFDRYPTRAEMQRFIEERIRQPRLQKFVMKNLQIVGRKRLSWRLNIQGIYENLDHVFSAVEHPGTFTGPTLFIRGGNSDYVPEEDFERIRKNFPNAQFETIKGASHWVHADRPDELCSVLTNFLGKACSVTSRS